MDNQRPRETEDVSMRKKSKVKAETIELYHAAHAMVEAGTHNVDQAAKKAGIAFSTYFRAQRQVKEVPSVKGLLKLVSLLRIENQRLRAELKAKEANNGQSSKGRITIHPDEPVGYGSQLGR